MLQNDPNLIVKVEILQFVYCFLQILRNMREIS